MGFRRNPALARCHRRRQTPDDLDHRLTPRELDAREFENAKNALRLNALTLNALDVAIHLLRFFCSGSFAPIHLHRLQETEYACGDESRVEPPNQ